MNVSPINININTIHELVLIILLQKLALMASEENLQSLKVHLLSGAMESSEYCLISTSKWCAEQAHALSVPILDLPTPPKLKISPDNLPRFLFARNLFAMKEYLRAFELLESCEEAPALFLHFYCKLVPSTVVV